MTQNASGQTRATGVRSQLWYALLDAERESRYFAKVADRNKRLYMFFSVVTMIFSLTAGATLLMATPIGWTVGLFLLVSSLTALMIVYDFSGHARSARIASDLIRGVCLELKQAWYRGPELSSLEYVSTLERRLDEIARIDHIIDDKLNKQCADDAYKVILDEIEQRGTRTSVRAES
jgi:hypothetical protein